ncbi:hypothetical protein [Leifsonia aquatica]|uniref:hypothetical protein n=1 Tax=Leifsonia aquatica TaxID=144185 RepID=UPI000468B4CE|nr:hypothetical protein [Leifsonia aquatica]
MSRELETTYRRALRWYPATWRARNADALLSMLLDRAEGEGRSAPAPGELFDLAVHGMGARLEAVLPRNVRSGAATLALGYGAVFSVFQLWTSWWAPLSPGTAWLRSQAPDVNTFGPFLSPGVVLTALWVLALALALTGATRSARVLLLVSAACAALLPTINAVVPGWDGPSTTNLLFFGLSALIAASAPSRRGMLVIGLPAWILLFVGLAAANRMLIPDYPYDRQFWIIFAARIPPSVLVASLALIVVLLLLARKPAAVPVFAIAVTPWVGCWYAATLSDNPSGALSWGIAGAFALVVLVLVALGLRRAGLRVSIERRSVNGRATRG